MTGHRTHHLRRKTHEFHVGVLIARKLRLWPNSGEKWFQAFNTSAAHVRITVMSKNICHNIQHLSLAKIPMTIWLIYSTSTPASSRSLHHHFSRAILLDNADHINQTPSKIHTQLNGRCPNHTRHITWIADKHFECRLNPWIQYSIDAGAAIEVSASPSIFARILFFEKDLPSLKRKSNKPMSRISSMKAS